MVVSLALCLLASVFIYLLVRNGTPSLGLPFAYLFITLIIYVPGAVAHLCDPGLPYHYATVIGIRLTGIGLVAFAAGVWISRFKRRGPGISWPPVRLNFQIFALIVGWIVTFSVRHLLVGIPSFNAVADTGAQIWILPIILAFAICVHRGDILGFIIWGLASVLFPVTMLIFGGFLCHGVETMVICLAVLVVLARSHLVVVTVLSIISVAGMAIFISYFLVRADIRDVAWGEASVQEQIIESTRIVTEFRFLDLEDPDHLDALNQRLNQGFFAGLAAFRLKMGIVDYYRGRTFWEGVLALIPRLIWPEKPVYGGSPAIIQNMSGYYVGEGSSFGVGQVMEFYINYGMASLIAGFVLLGWALGTLDRMAATAYVEGKHRRLMSTFLPAIALIQPNGSVVELVGGAAAAWIAAYGYGMIWSNFIVKKQNHAEDGLTQWKKATNREQEPAMAKTPSTKASEEPVPKTPTFSIALDVQNRLDDQFTAQPCDRLLRVGKLARATESEESTPKIDFSSFARADAS